MMFIKAVKFSLLSFLLICCRSTTPGAESVHAVVAGFERFARHADIQSTEAGKLLLTELSCTACHASNAAELQAKGGPKLESVARRLRGEWISQFLNDPQAVDPGTTMPDVLTRVPAAQKPRVIEALSAYLATQSAPLPELKATGANPVLHEFWNKGNATAGKQLYHQTGCVACHEPAADQVAKTDPAIEKMLEELEPEELAKIGLAHAARTIPSIPLPDLRAKYTAQGLAMFLLDPSNVRPSARMPNMKLRTSDAADLVAWLQSRSAAAVNPTRTTINKALVEEGRKLFANLGCANCHTASGVKANVRAKPLGNVNPGAEHACTTAAPSGTLAHYALDHAQRAALVAGLEGLSKGTSQPPGPSDQVRLTMLQLNCFSCHQRDGLGGVARGRDGFFETKGQVDIGDEGRLPPPLTGVGRKLVTPHLTAVLTGTGDMRPHLQIRMPKYPASEVDAFVDQLALADGVKPAPASKRPPQVDESLVNAGRVLFNLGCVQCHPLKGESLPGVVGIEVGRIGQRVRQSWFHDFLLNPASLKPRTRMPTFFAPGSVNSQVLNGDVEKQIAALWSYLEDIDRQPLPDKVEQSRRQNFELIPRDKPIILRTFMQLAGTHAIAVGFPQRVHYAFDAESLRLAELWGERFIDAQGTWNDRMAPIAAPLTTARIPLPPGPDFALLANKNAAWPEVKLDSPLQLPPTQARFQGYQLDKEGVPEFQYSVGPYEVYDRIVPATPERVQANPAWKTRLTSAAPNKKGLIRELRVQLKAGNSASQEGLWYRAVGSGKQLQHVGNSWTYASSLTVTLPDEFTKTAYSRNSGGQSQVLLPLVAAPETKFSILYSW